jgi:hypothetical protein
VPRAGDDPVLDHSVAQRAASVQTQVVDGEDTVAKPEDSHMTAVDDYHPAGVIGKIRQRSDGLKLRHYFRAAGVSVVSFFSLPRM